MGTRTEHTGTIWAPLWRAARGLLVTGYLLYTLSLIGALVARRSVQGAEFVDLSPSGLWLLLDLGMWTVGITFFTLLYTMPAHLGGVRKSIATALKLVFFLLLTVSLTAMAARRPFGVVFRDGSIILVRVSPLDSIVVPIEHLEDVALHETDWVRSLRVSTTTGRPILLRPVYRGDARTNKALDALLEKLTQSARTKGREHKR